MQHLTIVEDMGDVNDCFFMWIWIM